ncbi:alpha/beta hydrolase [Clostridium vincentii]|uniref:2-succinyl-6-hydroxy-2, 4-cyclohexadiene-1-carboxylate synthase n=1 Tax=Clostridium vincentii TaxID=52704 RepID=A0A2T0BF97_9CLOT|nr:alpha/beta fold hydrolase [Clostridium vincentii]PRR82538.1 2-succinyl-6-hydroxy-2,4-cyclohexadiene-1-carboxylate synthase [Clostridium vincentii]
MLEKIKDIWKKYFMLSCFMCILTMLTLFLLVKFDDLVLGLVVMAILLLILNILFCKLLNRFVKSKRIKTCFLTVLILINIIVSASTTISLLSDQMFFYPNQDKEAYNKNLKNENYEEIKITKDDDILNGWLLKNIEGKAPLIIYFGGNGECSARRFDNNFVSKKWGYFEEYNFMMVDYPGYGNTSGTPSDKTMFENALKTYDYAVSREDVDQKNIVIMGYSIGTGVATYLASQRDIKSLILLAPYDEGITLYNSQVNIFYGPLKYLVKYKFESIEYAKSVKVKPLILASKDDELIPYSSSFKLSNQFPCGSNLITYEGFKHNDFWGQIEVLEKVEEHLQEVKDE